MCLKNENTTTFYIGEVVIPFSTPPHEHPFSTQLVDISGAHAFVFLEYLLHIWSGGGGDTWKESGHSVSFFLMYIY